MTWPNFAHLFPSFGVQITLKSLLPESDKDTDSMSAESAVKTAKTCPLDSWRLEELASHLTTRQRCSHASLWASKGSSRPRDQTHVCCIGRQILHHCTTREVPVLGTMTFIQEERSIQADDLCAGLRFAFYEDLCKPPYTCDSVIISILSCASSHHIPSRGPVIPFCSWESWGPESSVISDTTLPIAVHSQKVTKAPVHPLIHILFHRDARRFHWVLSV